MGGGGGGEAWRWKVVPRSAPDPGIVKVVEKAPAKSVTKRVELSRLTRSEQFGMLRNAKLSGFIFDLFQDRLMAHVHAIKVTDRNDATLMLFPKINQATNNFHLYFFNNLM